MKRTVVQLTVEENDDGTFKITSMWDGEQTNVRDDIDGIADAAACIGVSGMAFARRHGVERVVLAAVEFFCNPGRT